MSVIEHGVRGKTASGLVKTFDSAGRSHPLGATLVPGRKSESIMKADLIAAASEVITNQQILVNMVSRRVRQL